LPQRQEEYENPDRATRPAGLHYTSNTRTMGRSPYQPDAKTSGQRMTSTFETVLQRYESLSELDKARAMGRMSWYLTIAARDMCLSGDAQQQRDKLSALNELQHAMLSRQLEYLEARQRRSPDRDFILALFRSSKASDLTGHLQYAFDKALSEIDRGDQFLHPERV
jgi:hypothetical protein